jgi:hypothetical protein
MVTHPQRILNIDLYSQFVNLCVQNVKSTQVHGDIVRHEHYCRQFVHIIQFMTRYHFYLSGSDQAGDRFHFAYWGK